jgi:hypothetical protein
MQRLFPWTKRRNQEDELQPCGDVPETGPCPKKGKLAEASTKELVEPEERYGMFVLEDKPTGQERLVDIVAIHGLNGHYYNTWAATSSTGKQNWLKDFLPKQIPNARIMSYGYNSALQFSKSVADLTSFADHLLNDLKTFRNTPQELDRPLIFVCHSLGGLLFKRVRKKKCVTGAPKTYAHYCI